MDKPWSQQRLANRFEMMTDLLIYWRLSKYNNSMVWHYKTRQNLAIFFISYLKRLLQRALTYLLYIEFDIFGQAPLFHLIQYNMHRKNNNTSFDFNQISRAYTSLQDFLSYIVHKFMKSTKRIWRKSFYLINYGMEIVLFLILIGQTLHIISNKNSHVMNSRHLLVKWICLLVIFSVSNLIKDHTEMNQLFRFTCNLIAFGIVYPSKFIKELHLKSLAYKERKNQQGQLINDIQTNQVSIFQKIITSFVWFLLKLSKLAIIFVPLTQRRQIQEQIRDINNILIEQKSFWKIYESKRQQNSQSKIQKTNKSSTSNSFNRNKVQKSLQTINAFQQRPHDNNHFSFSQQNGASEIKIQQKEQINLIKVQAQQHIQMNLPSFQSELGSNRKFVFYRQVSIQYNPKSAQLTLIGRQDKKKDNYILAEIIIVDQNIIQLQCQNQEELISIKFKTPQDKQFFINDVNTLS